jgi:type II secretory pathway component PulK
MTDLEKMKSPRDIKRGFIPIFSQIKCCRFNKARDNSGIVIYVILWVLVILTALALSLGRSTQIELALTKHTLSSLRTENLAWAGIIYAKHLIQEDAIDDESAAIDTLYYCGISLTKGNLPDIFKNRSLKTGTFTIGYNYSGQDVYGLSDEERFININTLTFDSLSVLKNLLTNQGVDVPTAEKIVASVIDWRDEDSVVSSEPLGAEDEYYSSLSKPYHCKNKAFDSKEELLLVKGMTQDIYDKIKDEITIFPKEGNFQVNFDTASQKVLLAFALSLAGPSTNTDPADAESLVRKMIEYRSGDDGLAMTIDDRELDLGKLNFNEKEKVIALVMNQFKTKKSNYLRVRVTGQDQLSRMSSRLEAIIERDSQKIVYWHRDN